MGCVTKVERLTRHIRTHSKAICNQCVLNAVSLRHTERATHGMTHIDVYTVILGGLCVSCSVVHGRNKNGPRPSCRDEINWWVSRNSPSLRCVGQLVQWGDLDFITNVCDSGWGINR